MFLKVQAFCLKFIKIREADALFNLLKQLEKEDIFSHDNINNTTSIKSVL